jgi:hypothetical protein
VNLLNSGSEVPTIGTLNLNVGGYRFQFGTLQLGGAATINVQSDNQSYTPLSQILPQAPQFNFSTMRPLTPALLIAR